MLNISLQMMSYDVLKKSCRPFIAQQKQLMQLFLMMSWWPAVSFVAFAAWKKWSDGVMVTRSAEEFPWCGAVAVAAALKMISVGKQLLFCLERVAEKCNHLELRMERSSGGLADASRHLYSLMKEWGPKLVKDHATGSPVLEDQTVFWVQRRLRERYEAFFGKRQIACSHKLWRMLCTETVWRLCRDFCFDRLGELERGKVFMENVQKKRQKEKMTNMMHKGLQMWEPCLSMREFAVMQMKVDKDEVDNAQMEVIMAQLMERLVEIWRTLEDAVVAARNNILDVENALKFMEEDLPPIVGELGKEVRRENVKSSAVDCFVVMKRLTRAAQVAEEVDGFAASEGSGGNGE